MRLSIAGLASLALLAFLAMPLAACDRQKHTIPETRADAGYGGSMQPQTIIFTPY